ncbi:MAG: flagellar hook capping protein [Candidatus Riflebacteria bacterium]|nr:flagellar hook capping protein [Candidatus Riflebacteria bacterium]
MATTSVTDAPLVTTDTSAATRVAKKEMGKDDFLMLLTQQLKNQDPMKPMDNTEFSSQMAQFSTVEQLTNLASSMDKFITSSTDNYKVQAMGMLGTSVTATLATSPNPVVGKVDSVKFVGGEAVFSVGGTDVKMTDIQMANAA